MDRPLAPRMGLQLPGPSALLRPLRTHRPHLGGRTRVLLAGLAVALCLFAVGWLWLRHSSLFSASHVRIEGVRGPQAAAIDGALLEVAHHMSTLDVNTAALRAAVAPFRVVGDVRATASFPHSLRIEVTEQLPVAALTSSGSRTAVAADGVVLGPGLLRGSLPTVAVAQLPPTGRRVSGAMLGALTVLGAAPPPLRVHVAAVATGGRGLTVTMRNGLIVYFGDATRAHAKWLALAAVLADPTAAGAGYVDVRVPARPAAGYAPGSAPASAQPAGTTAQSGSPGSESAVSAIAAGLTPAGGSTASSTATPGAAGTGTATEPAAQPPSSSGEATPGGGGSEAATEGG